MSNNNSVVRMFVNDNKIDEVSHTYSYYVDSSIKKHFTIHIFYRRRCEFDDFNPTWEYKMKNTAEQVKFDEEWIANGERIDEYEEFYQSGQLKMAGTYVDGQQDGKWIENYPSGNQKSNYYYHSGKKRNGKEYYENGRIKTVYRSKPFEMSKRIEFDFEGNLISSFEYDDYCVGNMKKITKECVCVGCNQDVKLIYLSCGHLFHRKCLYEILRHYDSIELFCPYCSKRIDWTSCGHTSC